MPLKFKNNAHSTLAAGINASALSFSVAAAHGARFPTLGAGDYMLLTFINAANVREIVKVTARATDVFTIAADGRGYDGTAAASWLTGDAVELLIPNAAIAAITGNVENIIEHGALADGVTSAVAAIQRALATGNDVLVEPDANGNRDYYLGTVLSGTTLSFVRSHQRVIFKGGAQFTLNGTVYAGTNNSACFIEADSLDGCGLVNPTFVSNGTVLTTTDRDSPYGFRVLCTTAHANGCFITNGKGTKVQSMFVASKTDFSNTFNVNNAKVDYFSDRSFYGIILENTGDNTEAQIEALDNHRAFIIYGVSAAKVNVHDRHVSNLNALSQAILGVGVSNQDTTTKHTIGNKIWLVTKGSTYTGGSRLVLSAQYSAAGLAAIPSPNNLKILDNDIYFDDTGNPGTTSISHQYSLDGVLQTAFTGTLFDGNKFNGRMATTWDLTSQGAIGSPLTQSTKGRADFSGMRIGTLPSGTSDPMNGYLYEGQRSGDIRDNISFTPTIIGSSAAGVGTYSVQLGRASKNGKMIHGWATLTWSAHTGTGNILIGLGSLGSSYPAENISGSITPVVITASNLVFPDTLAASISAGAAYINVGTFGTGAAAADLAMDTAATVRVQFSYPCDT